MGCSDKSACETLFGHAYPLPPGTEQSQVNQQLRCPKICPLLPLQLGTESGSRTAGQCSHSCGTRSKSNVCGGKLDAVATLTSTNPSWYTPVYRFGAQTSTNRFRSSRSPNSHNEIANYPTHSLQRRLKLTDSQLPIHESTKPSYHPAGVVSNHHCQPPQQVSANIEARTGTSSCTAIISKPSPSPLFPRMPNIRSTRQTWRSDSGRGSGLFPLSIVPRT